ncbi:L,D-transpeptidase [Bacillus cereus]|uniref:L,D-transpeptidase n=1 Tax=Bacillus cereus TaxID=1396 RepID=A0A9X7GVQ4_BACCE|nr:L,D-transpeptidase [Bacillus cereus]PGS78518.1 L,D-transpeptidase [Bacillus cereus]
MNFIGKLILTLIVMVSCVHHVQASTVKGKYILIKRSEQKLYYVKSKLLLKSFPVETSCDESPTPAGRYTFVYKEEKRPFYKGNIAGGVSNNPLGEQWLDLNINGAKGNTFGLYGTNRVGSIGIKGSTRCIRMKNADVEWLYNHVARGTPVIIH